MRLTGTLTARDNKRRDIVTIAHGGASVEVSTRLLDDMRQVYFKKGSTYQFIGELQETRAVVDAVDATAGTPPAWRRLLKARVVSQVDGMNMKLYVQALQVQRDFLARFAKEQQQQQQQQQQQRRPPRQNDDEGLAEGFQAAKRQKKTPT